MISFYVNMDGLERIEFALGMVKDKSKHVLRTALNKTADETMKRMMKGATKRYSRNEGGIATYKEVTNAKPRAKVGKLEAFVVAKDRANDLYQYKISNRNYYPGSAGGPSHIKGKQLKSSKLQYLALNKGSSRDKYKAFVVRYPSSKHLAVAQRIPGSHMRSNPKKEALKSLYATNRAKGEEIVYRKEVDKDMYDILMKQIETQIMRYIK